MENKMIYIQRAFAMLFIVFSNVLAFSQDFTWKKGSNLTNQTGIYGSIGVAAPGNNPGARSSATSWKDANGNFWLFGGEGRDFIGNNGRLNDLWKFDPLTNNWTWVKGDNIIDQPGSYGTSGVASATNKPGSRTSAVCWFDGTGNFWMFGGYGYDGFSSLGYLNDLWKYNLGSNQWTWMNGSNTTNQVATYGTLGVPTSSTVPGSRLGASVWKDPNGNLWLFGGTGFPAINTLGKLNDLWMYDITSNEWTWQHGSNAIDQNGTYGTLGTASPANRPGGRSQSQTWVDNSGNFWLLGGDGYDASVPASSYLSDLWRYSSGSNEWTWIKGNNTINQNGVYGTQGIANGANIPGARSGGITWIDAIGTMWLFGGRGFTSAGVTTGEQNDLWSYKTGTNEWTWVKSSSVLDQAGFYGTIGVPGVTNRPGGRHGAVSWIDASNNLWLFGGNGFPNAGFAGDLNDVWKYTNCFISPITMTIMASDSTTCAGETASLTVTGSNNYVWSQNTATTSFLVINPTSTSTFSVFTSDANGCVYTSAFTQTVSACQGLQNLSSADSKSMVYPQPNNGGFFLKYSSQESIIQFSIIDILGKVVYETEIFNADERVNSNLESGIYFYKIVGGGKVIGSGKILVNKLN